MNNVITTEKIPVKFWLDDIEDGAKNQALDLAKLPFAFHHIAIMPDSHLGYGMPIGGVMATKHVIVPNAVGVDIGCGMCAVKTTLTEISKEALKAIMGDIRKCVPVGFNHHKTPIKSNVFDDAPVTIDVIYEELDSARCQLGTLGGGNHFIEIQKGSDGFIWIMLHSGSRNFGLKIAKRYHEKAKQLCEKWFSNIPNKDLSFLPDESDEFDEYNMAMNFAVKFAKANRLEMMYNICRCFGERIYVCMFNPIIDVAHNYAKYESHFGENVMVHRKGATSAREGEIGIIPGSQGTKSYIVKGKGNPESFMSCSHGAGRKMGRKQASKELDLEVEKKKLDDLGIIHGMRNKEDLDEAPGAYKNIDVVMKNQSDLVEIVTELTPLAVIKA
jgi:tRNA-splicing ligase RtcB